MTGDVRLAEPKLVPLTQSEQAEAVRLLAALLRASIAAHAIARVDGGASRVRHQVEAGPVSGSRSSGSRPEASCRSAAGLPMAREANGKRASRETAGETR
jgi:hypothetical protein